MPTVITKNVDTGGTGDYSTLSSAESGEQAIRPDLVANDEQLVFNCTASAGGADGSRAIIDGYTTDATRNIVIHADNDPHNGTWSTGAYRLELSNSSSAMAIQDPYVTVRLIQVNNTHTSGGAIVLSSVGSTWTLLDRCIAKTTGANKTGTGISATGTATSFYLRNCLVYDFSGTGGTGYSMAGLANSTKIYNCTVHNCATGFTATGSTPIIKNCLAKSCGTDFSGSWNAASDYNVDEDGSAPGSNSQTGAATFANEGADDFHLTSSDTVAYNLGTDLSGDANNPVTIDVDGTARPQGGVFDIGFDEVVTSTTRRIFVVS